MARSAHLIGGVPGVGVGHRGERERRPSPCPGCNAARPLNLRTSSGRGPRTVVGVEFAGIEQEPSPTLVEPRARYLVVAEAADGDRLDVLLDAVPQRDVQVAGVFEVADVGEIRAFADIHAADGFRNEPVEVGVALPVHIGRQIDRHVVHKDGDVGAVIEIPAAQVILIGLAAVGMLDRHQAGRRFEDLAGARDRTRVEVLAGNRHLARQLRHRRAPPATLGAPVS